MSGTFHIVGESDNQTKLFLVVTDEPERAKELANIMGRSGKYDAVVVRNGHKVYQYPHLEDLK